MGRSAAVSGKLRNDTLWRRRGLSEGPSEPIRHSVSGCFVWRPRLLDIKEGALSLAPETACAMYADASGASGWGASQGDAYMQGAWSGVAETEGTNWRELWVLGEAIRQWPNSARGKLIT